MDPSTGSLGHPNILQWYCPESASSEQQTLCFTTAAAEHFQTRIGIRYGDGDAIAEQITSLVEANVYVFHIFFSEKAERLKRHLPVRETFGNHL